MKNCNSPYTATITGGGFLFEETNAILPILQSEDCKALLDDEILNNRILHVNAETSRKRFISEIRRRYENMPTFFWKDYQSMSYKDQMAALFYVILQTYKIVFDFHINVAIRKWNSIAKSLTYEDLMMELDEISAHDGFVDSWTDNTKSKVVSAYLSILRKIGMLDKDSQLHPLQCSNYDYYLRNNDSWFLEACLLQPYQIETIKKTMI